MAIPWALLGLLAFAAGKKKEAGDKLEYEPQNVFWSKSQKKFVLKLDIVNRTSTELKIDGMSLGVLLNEKNIGSIEYNNPFTIPKRGRKSLDLPIKANILGGAAALYSLILSKLKPQYDKEGNKIKTKISVQIAGVVRAYGLDNSVSFDEVELSI